MKANCAAALAALCAGLFACASPAPPPAPVPAAHTDPVDGTYRGTSTRFQADSRQCPHPGLVEVVVWENKFQYKWDYQVYIDATITPDDTIQGSGPGITLVGKHIGHSIDGDITNGVCGLHFTLKLVE